MFAIIVGVGSVYWQASMITLSYDKLLPYAITSIMGLLVIFHVGQFVSEHGHSKIKQFLIYVGNYTFNVLTWHFISMKVISLFIILVYHLPIERLAEFPVISDYARQGWWVAYFIAGVAIPIGVEFAITTCRERLSNVSRET